MTKPYSGAFRVTSPYGTRIDPISGDLSFHSGVDLVGEDKFVTSVADGVILVSQLVSDPENPTSEWGNYIAVLHSDGVIAYYCHLSERMSVAGEKVEEGEVLGIEGRTGRVTGSHLHFEVRKNGVSLNPAEYIGIPNEVGASVKQDQALQKPSTKNGSTPSDWAKEAVDWAKINGILTGDSSGDLMLKKTATREETVVMLHRMFSVCSGTKKRKKKAEGGDNNDEQNTQKALVP